MKSITLTGSLTVPAPVDRAFPLFSPLGEKDWVPGWAPELIHPEGAAWEKGLIFRTPDEEHDAVWVVTELDRAAHRVSYYRVEPFRLVATIRVECDAMSAGKTSVRVSYTFISLTPDGEAFIDQLSQPGFEAKMKQWQKWIEPVARRNPTRRWS